MDKQKGTASPANDYVGRLARMSQGDIVLLRACAGRGPGESPEAFRLFAELWWPSRRSGRRAPRREAAWLVAKLYASRPVPQLAGATLARQMRRQRPGGEVGERFRKRFDAMLLLPLTGIEPEMRWAVGLASRGGGLDWARLVDDLSAWARQATRSRWANDFLG